MRKLITFTVAALMSASVLAASEIYRWKDANGNWHYSDQPQPGAELVRSSRSATATPAPPAPPPAPAPAAQTIANSEAPPVSDSVAREVRQQANAIRAEQCKQAEEIYQQSLQARRIYRLDENGNRTYMSEAEMDAQRLEARSNRDLACGT